MALRLRLRNEEGLEIDVRRMVEGRLRVFKGGQYMYSGISVEGLARMRRFRRGMVFLLVRG